jgi:hypothetical protein
LTLEPCSTALKEWDAQIQALKIGRTALIVRKGGIVEKSGEFEVTHERFWLYPTFLHQNPGELKLEHHDLLRENPEPGLVTLRSFAVVEGVWKLENLETIRNLESENALTADALERKFRYRNKPYVHALLLRVYNCDPITLPETEAYAGCVSWVPLEQPLEPKNAKVALELPLFQKQKEHLERMLPQN